MDSLGGTISRHRSKQTCYQAPSRFTSNARYAPSSICDYRLKLAWECWLNGSDRFIYHLPRMAELDVGSRLIGTDNEEENE